MIKQEILFDVCLKITVTKSSTAKLKNPKIYSMT